MKYENYETTKHDSRNVSLWYKEKGVYKENQFIPKGKKSGDEYVKKTHLGYFQKPEQLLNAVIDDMWIHHSPRSGIIDLEGLLAIMAAIRKEVNAFARCITSLKKEEIWP
jgi:hypothetical protein